MGFLPMGSDPDSVQAPSAAIARCCRAPEGSTSTPRVEPLRSRVVARKRRGAAAASNEAGVRGVTVSMALPVLRGLDESSWLLPRSRKDGLPGLMQELPRSSAEESDVLPPVECRPREREASTQGRECHPPSRRQDPRRREGGTDAVLRAGPTAEQRRDGTP